MNSVLTVIPVRLKSTRLPEKALIKIDGKTILQRTYDQCLQVINNEDLIVATDSEKIKNHCKNHNMNVVMTSNNCLTGTDRVAEVSNIINADYYINVQGDEPIINPNDILKIVNTAKYAEVDKTVLNGYSVIDNEKDYRSLTIPKVIIRNDGRLLYMSRSPIPGNKNGEFKHALKQVCIYAFPKKMLKVFSEIKNKTKNEALEDIEILRFLDLGYDVRMVKLVGDSVAVDTPDDVERVKSILRERSKC